MSVKTDENHFVFLLKYIFLLFSYVETTKAIFVVFLFFKIYLKTKKENTNLHLLCREKRGLV